MAKSIFKTTMPKSSLRDLSDAYILAKRTIAANNTAVINPNANNCNQKLIFKSCALFTNCMT